MELLIPGNYYIELTRVSDLISVDIVVNNFKINNGILEINVLITSKYYKGDYETEYSDQQNKKISLLIDDSICLENITFRNISGEVVVNQGVQLIYDMILKYSDTITEEPMSKEEIIDTIDEEKDEILTTKLLERSVENENNIDILEYTDELESDQLIELEVSYTTIKIIRVETEKDIEAISLRYNIPLREIYEQNNFKIDNKVIVKVNEWY